MANSLQDQLLKAGLVKQQKAKETRSDKHKTNKRTGNHVPGPDEATLRAAERASAEKAERDRELNRKRQEEATRRATANELRQLIHAHRVLREGGDLAYNFTDGAALKRLHVNRDLQAQLVDGRLAVVRQDAFYELVPAAIAERIKARDATLILVWNQGGGAPAADDPYADFKVPDDLMW